MRILYLSVRQSWPPVTGAKLRDYYLARSLGIAGDLTYVFFNTPLDPSICAQDVPFAGRMVVVPRPAMYSPGKLLRGLWQPLPIVNYTSPEMHRAVGQLLREGNFDLVHLDSIHLMALEDLCRKLQPRLPVLYNWHNIESELMRRHSASDISAPRKAYAALTASKLEQAENRILERAQGHIVCSERERELLLQRQPKARIAVIENGVDALALAEGCLGEGCATPSPRFRVAFVGSMNYHANVDAAVWFTKEIWPRIRQKHPSWRLTLVGSQPVAAVQDLAREPAVEVTGTVPDVRPYYRESIAAVVPLRVGGGTRLKILEALAAGVPVISTPIGAEGLAVIPGQHVLFATTPEDWRLAFDQLQQPGKAESLVQAGRVLAQKRYDWNVIGKTLIQTYRGWLDLSQKE